MGPDQQREAERERQAILATRVGVGRHPGLRRPEKPREELSRNEFGEHEARIVVFTGALAASALSGVAAYWTGWGVGRIQAWSDISTWLAATSIGVVVLPAYALCAGWISRLCEALCKIAFPRSKDWTLERHAHTAATWPLHLIYWLVVTPVFVFINLGLKR